MISPLEFQNQIKSIFDDSLNSQKELGFKDDGSAVTNLDIEVERRIIDLIEKNFNGITIISEENPQSHQSSYDLSDRNFAIIDPIDGTENFYFFNEIYGSVVSVVYGEFEYHGIYVPSRGDFFSTLSKKSKLKTLPKTKLLSTSCLSNVKRLDLSDRSLYRILGSSSYMFYLLLQGKAFSYTYCSNAKIWDCYTGLTLLYFHANFYKIELLDKNGVEFNPYSNSFDHFTSFHAQTT